MICCSAQRSVRNASRSFSFLQELATGCAILETDNLVVFMVSERVTIGLSVRPAKYKHDTGGLGGLPLAHPRCCMFLHFFALRADLSDVLPKLLPLRVCRQEYDGQSLEPIESVVICS